MKQAAFFCVLGFVCAFLQTAVLPLFLPPLLRPDLFILVLVVLSLSANYLHGAMIAWVLGALKDVFVGQTLGLHGFVFVLTFFLIKGTERRLNTESALLLVLLVFFATLIQGWLTAAVLLILDEAGRSWQVVLRRLPVQALVGSVTAWLILLLQARLFPGASKPSQVFGFRLTGKHHES